MAALRAAMDNKQSVITSNTAAQRMLNAAADDLIEADTTGNYSELVDDLRHAAKALNEAGQVVAGIGDNVHPQTKAVIEEAITAGLRQWLAEQDADK